MSVSKFKIFEFFLVGFRFFLLGLAVILCRARMMVLSTLSLALGHFVYEICCPFLGEVKFDWYFPIFRWLRWCHFLECIRARLQVCGDYCVWMCVLDYLILLPTNINYPSWCGLWCLWNLGDSSFSSRIWLGSREWVSNC